MEQETNKMPEHQKFCKHCGQLIDKECIICPKCGKQVEQFAQPNVVINNTNQNQTVNNVRVGGRPTKECNKWVSFFLCLFFGCIGVHKFYEGKTGLGILYLFTLGLVGFGAFIDLIIILTKPNPYYV